MGASGVSASHAPALFQKSVSFVSTRTKMDLGIPTLMGNGGFADLPSPAAQNRLKLSFLTSFDAR